MRTRAGGTFFTELKADPGALGLDSLLAESGNSFGLLGMRERAAAVGGRIEYGPGPDGGFRRIAGCTTEALLGAAALLRRRDA